MTKKSQAAENYLDWLKKNFYHIFLKKYTNTKRQYPALNQTAGDHDYASKDYFNHPGSR